jgi:hypothetical protein
MSFQFSDAHIADYHALGYTIFRGILPPSLIRDLRGATDKAREVARQKRGTQAQRLQPLADYDVDMKPFQGYAELPQLKEAIAKVLTPAHRHGTLTAHPTEATYGLGVLLEPADMPWCTRWHRDWRDNIPGLPLAKWDAVYRDTNFFNQVNCALYEDSSTWAVPGSHLRRDLPSEVRRFPGRPIPAPEPRGETTEEKERWCLEYCRSMPGAARIYLDAGDFMLYRNTLWHLGSYVPYRKRATLHEAVLTPEYLAWADRLLKECAQRKEAGFDYENPNHSPA